jgi:hypothetical protein
MPWSARWCPGTRITETLSPPHSSSARLAPLKQPVPDRGVPGRGHDGNPQATTIGVKCGCALTAHALRPASLASTIRVCPSRPPFGAQVPFVGGHGCEPDRFHRGDGDLVVAQSLNLA